MQRRICVIFNPAASGEKARRFHEHLNGLAGQCSFKPTTGPGAKVGALAAEAVREGFDIIIAAGGDGTINEVINGIGDEATAFERVRLGLLPIGTANVFARELKVPLNFQRAWEVILNGEAYPVDLARAEFEDQNKPCHRYFIQLAGAGFDSRSIELVDWAMKKRFGAISYLYAGLKALCGPLPFIQLEADGQQFAGQLVLIGNGRLYGGSFRLFPLADLQDGLLDVTVFPKVNPVSILRAVSGLLSNRLYSWGGACNFRAARVTLKSEKNPWFQVDGENAGRLPVTFSIEGKRLLVLAPRRQNRL